MDKDKKPYPFEALALLSFIFGVGASYVLILQNLKRMGKHDLVKKLIFPGSIILIIALVLLYFLSSLNRFVLQEFSLISLSLFYLLFWRKYENKKEAKFEWSAIGWALVGFTLVYGIFAIFAVTENTILGVPR
ncbi:MAG: hypothetical protein AAB656_01790 [Patescibacteria group bacterium]